MTDITRKMLPFLAWEKEARGKDSWGVSCGDATVRVLGPITETFSDYEDEINAWDRVILHTRGASTGDVTILNQHPFEVTHNDSDGNWVRTVIGIHNGIVANHEALNEKYSRKNEVDSMHIYQHIAAGLPTSEIHGWGNLAWYEYNETNPEGMLKLLRFNNDALHVVQLTSGEIVFCSTTDPLYRAARMAGSGVKMEFEIKAEYVYSIHTDGKLYKSNAIVPFGTRSYTPPFVHHYSSDTSGDWWKNRYRHGYDAGDWNNFPSQRHGFVDLHNLQQMERTQGICATSGCVNRVTKNRRESLICQRCVDEVLKDLAVVA